MRSGRLRRHPSASARGGAAAALIAFACSVYEVPGTTSDSIGGGSTGDAAGESSGEGATAGKTPSGGSGAGGSAGADAISGAGSSTAGSSTAGSSAGTPTHVGGAGGEPAVDPTSGGEGGSPTVEEDACPNDPDKLAAGECGCGVPDPPSAEQVDCRTLKALLVHRYDFEGDGTAVRDRVGTDHGAVKGGGALSKLAGKGVVLLGGPYVDLPNGIMSSLTNATLEAWVTWGGGDSWQRIFDFGDSTATPAENNPDTGKTYLYLTPKNNTGTLQLAFTSGGFDQEVTVKGGLALAQTMKQVVVVAADSANLLTLYIDGVKMAEQPWTGALSQVNDVNVWLGRSQYASDPELNAVYHEFRMYKAALTAAQVAAMFKAGTDPQFLSY